MGNKQPRCIYCNEPEHLSMTLCRNYKYCTFCNNIGHNKIQCHYLNCTLCGRYGHNNAIPIINSYCNLCNRGGHIPSNCCITLANTEFYG